MNNFLELAKSRFSVRNFENKAIEDEKLSLILEAGRVAPTAKNNQPQHIIVLKDKNTIAKLKEVCPCVYNSQLVLVVCFDKEREWKNNIQPGYTSGECDAAIVCTHMMLEAWDLNVGSCWVRWFNADEVAKVLDLPANLTVSALLPLGYLPEGASASPMHSSILPIEDTIEYR